MLVFSGHTLWYYLAYTGALDDLDTVADRVRGDGRVNFPADCVDREQWNARILAGPVGF